MIIIGIIVIVLSLLTYQRNKVWQTEISIWEDVIEKSPNKTRPYTNLAGAYILAGRYEDAIQVSIRGIKVDDADYSIYYHVGVAKRMLGDLEGAYWYANRAARLHRDEVTMANLGVILRDLGWKPGMPKPQPMEGVK